MPDDDLDPKADPQFGKHPDSKYPGNPKLRKVIALAEGAAWAVCLSNLQGQTCADQLLLDLAEWKMFKPNGRASQYLHHYLDGSGEPIYFDFAAMLQQEPGVRLVVVEAIKNATRGDPVAHCSGQFTIGQQAHDDKDWQYSVGSFHPVEWEAISGGPATNEGPGPLCVQKKGLDWIDSGTMALTRSKAPADRQQCSNGALKYAKLSGRKRYHYYEITDRADAAVHAAAARLIKEINAKPFWMVANPCVVDIWTGMPVTCLR